MKEYLIDLGDNENLEVPISIQNKIIQDHMIKSYHWVIGMSAFIIGFLLGIIAK